MNDIELRWVMRNVEYSAEPAAILQYRKRVSLVGYDEAFFGWSDWIDVPTVQE